MRFVQVAEGVKKIILAGCTLLLACIVTAGCGSKKESSSPAIDDSIFSWGEGYLHPENEEDVSKVMDELDCRALYQSIPEDADEKTVLEYLKRRKKRNETVFYLSGDASWGVEKDGRSMADQVKRAAYFNKKAEDGEGFAGIVWDVEPYLLDEWEENPEKIMKQYVQNCCDAYKRAQKEDLEVIVCIPYFYDKEGFEKELEQLVQYGCDAVAVMNYNKKDEAGQIRYEVETAEKYGKGILNIAELQEPGNYDLTDKHTYYHDGIEAVRKSFRALKKEYPYEKLGFSWHFITPAIELLKEGENL